MNKGSNTGVGFWNRLTAFALDGLILGIPFAIFVMPAVISMVYDVEELKKILDTANSQTYFELYGTIVELSIVMVILWAFTLAVFAFSKWQASPGKRIMNCYISDKNGKKAKFLQLFLRFAALPIALLTIQTPERFLIYENLQKITAGASKQDLTSAFFTPISQSTSLVTFILICVWYLLIVFRKDKAALHDILFDTRVVNGRP